MSPWLKWLGLGFALSLVVLAALVGGGWFWLRGSLPQIDGEIVLAGPHAQIEILRDAYGVPHIFAADPHDAFFGLGFVHAQDRLWQMETQRRVGAGRLSELFGQRTVETDRFLRILGIRHAAARQWEGLDEDAKAAYRAYAEGVNAWLAARSGPLPPEFVLFSVDPEPWDPVDSLAWVLMMAWDLAGNWQDELLRARLAGQLDPAQIAALWPDVDWEDADLPAGMASIYRSLPLDALAALDLAAPRLAGEGSNNWVVAGARSAAGAPLLANDPHLDLGLPSQWYLAHISAPGIEVAGATLPGLPAPVLGRNEHIAWGFTNTNPDVQDLFIERLDPNDPTRYLTPDGPQPFVVRHEVIIVSESSDVVIDVRESRHGPVISDASERAQVAAGEGHVLALAWTALDPENRSAQAGLHAALARDRDEFIHALRDFHAPQQNIIYADMEGHIGFIAPGWVPIRNTGNGRLPVPGWSGEYDWIGMVPFEALPHSLDPPSGVIVTANQRIVPADYPWFITDDWALPWRSRRIAELLGASVRHTPESFAAIQTDIRSGFAATLTPLLLARTSPATGVAEIAVGLLRGWNFAMAAGRPEPLIFAAWQRAFLRAMLADELGPLYEDFSGIRANLTLDALTHHSPFCDDVTTERLEDCASLVNASLEVALAELASTYGDDPAAWRWGEAHRLSLNHRIFSRLPVVHSLTGAVLATNGGSFTVNAASYAAKGPAPYAQTAGPGYRAIYDLTPGAPSRVIQNAGQSGNPFSVYYDDLIALWHDGLTIPLTMTRTDIEVAARLVLQPAPTD
jgi:penicillin amidase